MIKLIWNSEKNMGKTCRNSCELFDWITGGCSILKGLSMDSPSTLENCSFALSKVRKKRSTFKETDYEIQKHIQFVGEDFKNNTNSLYPIQPDRPSFRDDAVWFMSSCKRFGCWIINKSRKKFVVISNNCTKPVQRRNKRSYKSPYPLHDHCFSPILASRIAWYVDKYGIGQYVLLINGKMSKL